jgi:DNA-directed RNA polymerase omega subunit
MSISESRGSSIDLEKCVEQSGNRYKLVIEAAALARDIKRKNRHSPYREHQFPQVTSLKMIEEGRAK